MVKLVHMISIQGRELYLGDFVKNAFRVRLHSYAFERICIRFETRHK